MRGASTPRSWVSARRNATGWVALPVPKRRFLRLPVRRPAVRGAHPGRLAGRRRPPSAQALANGNRMLAHCLRPTTLYRPDLAALRAASARIVAGGGKTSAGQLAHRTAVALAEQLDTPLVEFPGDHEGFVGEPEPFAQTLHQVLTEAS